MAQGKIPWNWVFGAIGAVSGIVYLYQARNAQPAQTVTNVFPPLNTGEDSGQDLGVLPTSENANTTTQTPTQHVTKPYPVYMV